MAYQPVPDTAALTFKFQADPAGVLSGALAQFTWHFRQVDDWDDTDLQELADYGKDWWETGKGGGAAAKTFVGAAWSMVETIAKDLTQENGLEASAASGASGTMAGETVPANVAVLLRFRGDPGETPARWRTFFPGGTETKLSGNSWDATWRNDLLTAVNQFITNLPLGVAFVGVSRYEGTEPDPQAIRAVRREEAVTGTFASASVRQQVASQRDRRPPVS